MTQTTSDAAGVPAASSAMDAVPVQRTGFDVRRQGFGFDVDPYRQTEDDDA